MATGEKANKGGMQQEEVNRLLAFFHLRLLCTLLENLFHMPADEMRSTAEKINTAYKHNYPRQQTSVIEWGEGVDDLIVRVSGSVGFKDGKLAYYVRCSPEYSAKEVDSSGDTYKAKCYRQPLYL